MAKPKAKKKVARLRHVEDYERWFSPQVVQTRQVVETPWGEATAEPGTFILTDANDSSFQVIVTQDDLDIAWTTDPIPEPTPFTPPLMGEAESSPFPPDLPGRDPQPNHGHDHGA